MGRLVGRLVALLGLLALGSCVNLEAQCGHAHPVAATVDRCCKSSRGQCQHYRGFAGQTALGEAREVSWP